MRSKTTKNEELWIIKDKYNSLVDKCSSDDLLRLKRGEPVDYIIGWKPFLGCKIDLSFKPLIPRAETEFWVEKTISEIGKKKLKILDVFAGSGCVGIAILKHCPNTKVDFAEIDKNLIKQIKLNSKINGAKKTRSNVILSDIFTHIKGRYDFILANPPYIPTKHLSKVQKSVLLHEPHRALFGGETGLKFITTFLKQAKKHLNKGGQIRLEIDPSQKKSLEKIVKENSYTSLSFEKDQYGRWRLAIIILE